MKKTQQAMREILQHSDFALKISFVNNKGKPIKVSKFKFAYSTTLSDHIVAEFDGQNYSSNCRLEADGVLILFENPMFNVGQLRVRREYSIASSFYETGVKGFVECCDLPIAIVQSFSQDQSATYGEIPITTTQGEVIVLDTIVMDVVSGRPGEKGEKGDTGIQIDRSQFDEQLLDGQCWIGRNGTKKQLYGRRIRVSQNVVASGETGVVFFTNLQPMDSLCSTAGFFEGQDNNGHVQNAFPGFGVGACILRYEHTGGNIANSLTILCTNIDRGNIGKPFTVDLFLTYTKL